MKKLGFTLSELIVTMGIVGVLAAITAPILSEIIPNQDKIKVLKAYKTLTDINKELIEDNSLYMTDETCEGFDCIQQPLNPAYSDSKYSGDTKYFNLFLDKLNSYSIVQQVSKGSCTFTTEDGMEWYFLFTEGYPSQTDFKLRLYLNTDSSKERCSYFSNQGCKKYNTHAFVIDSYGIVEVPLGDCLTRAYLENPTKLNGKKEDLARAEELKSESKS